ncbi:MAG: Beta-galactosidase C-terminal domain, partial [Leifsonia flava]
RVADDGTRFTVLINHADTAASVGVAGTDLATGEPVTADAEVAGGAVRIVREK